MMGGWDELVDLFWFDPYDTASLDRFEEAA